MRERGGGTLQRSQYSVQQFPQGGTIWLKKKENEKSFYSLILLEQRFPLKIFLAKYVRILVKSVQLGYSSGNLSESFRIYQRLEASKQKIQGIVSVLQRNSGTPKASKYFVTRDISFRISYLLC